MPLNDADNRLADDRCAIMNRMRANEAIINHTLLDVHGSCDTPCKDRKAKLRNFAAAHPTLQFVDGFGLAPCDVDEDSALKHKQTWTNPRYRQQLRTRVFGAIPDLARGAPKPATESILISGQDTTYMRQCSRLAEMNWDRFAPNVDVQCEEHVIPEWTWGGDSSRDISRSKEFLQSIGYQVDTRTGFTSSSSCA